MGTMNFVRKFRSQSETTINLNKGSTSMASDNMVHRAQIGRRLENHARRLRKQKGIDKAQMQQEQVQATIQELFPKIPEDEAKAITKRAFEEVWHFLSANGLS